MSQIDMGLLDGVSDLFVNSANYVLLTDEEAIALGGVDVILRKKQDRLELTLAAPNPDLERPRLRLTIIPTTQGCLTKYHEITSRLKHSPSTLFPTFEYHPRSRFRSVKYREFTLFADMFVCDSPIGEPLVDYVTRINTNKPLCRQLYGAITALEDELRTQNCAIDHLDAEQIVVGEDGNLYPCDLDTLRFDCGEESYIGCDELRRWLSAMSDTALPQGITAPETSRYSLKNLFTLEGYVWCGTPHEERIAVQDASGYYGFVDMSNNRITECCFRSVTSFKEGRAVVESQRGYGLIDLWGNYILEDCYDDMSYDVASGVTVAKRGGQWAKFNYRGEQIAPFSSEYPTNEIFC